METGEDSFTVLGNAATMEDSVGNSQKIKMNLPCDPVMSFLGIDPKDSVDYKDTCTSMFVVALFTVAKRWKQLKCPTTVEWTMKM